MREKNTNGLSREEVDDLLARDRELLRGASAASRERARKAFLTGHDRAPGTRPGRARVVRLARIVVPLAAAAGLVGLVFLLGERPSEDWSVLALASPEHVRLNGARPSPRDTFGEGVGTTEELAELDVQLGKRIRLKLTPQSEVRFPPGPGRWFGKERVLEVHAGEVCGTTDGEALGFDLVIVTSEAEARVRGTTFAVTRDAEGTRICLSDLDEREASMLREMAASGVVRDGA